VAGKLKHGMSLICPALDVPTGVAPPHLEIWGLILGGGRAEKVEQYNDLVQPRADDAIEKPQGGRVGWNDLLCG